MSGASAAAGRERRRVRAFPVMGTVVSVDVRPPLVADEVLDQVEAWFHEVDARFSIFRADSEISRIAAGELAETRASGDVRAILSLADSLRERTDGFFDARRHRPDGRLDPGGVVKGWSVDEAVSRLRVAGAANGQVSAGGDLVGFGEPEPGRRWRVGIRHPDVADRVAAVLEVADLAVATSGCYERGAHIRDPHTGAIAPDGLRSLTVVGPTLAIADAFATAGLAMGEAGVSWVARQPGFGALAITRGGRVVVTPLVDTLLATPYGDGGARRSHALLTRQALNGLD